MTSLWNGHFFILEQPEGDPAMSSKEMCLSEHHL